MDNTAARRFHKREETSGLGRRRDKEETVTCHVARPLVALEVEEPSGLSDVLSRLLFLDLLDLLLGIFTQEVHACGDTSHISESQYFHLSI